MDLLGPNSDLIGSQLDLAALRQRVIQANIANLNTPGYKARKVAFDAFLGEQTILERTDTVEREDGNNVVLEVEDADMQKNSLVFRLFLEALSGKVRQMRTAISGRQ